MRPSAGFDAFVHSRGEDLRRLAFLLTGRRQDADALVVTALARLLARWRRVERSEDPYAASVALLSAARPPLLRRPPQAVDDTEELDADSLAEALPLLRGAERAVVVLRYAEGLSEDETADLLDRTPSWVHQRTARALGR